MGYIDDLLNRITTYRLTLYYLILLVGSAFVFSFFGLAGTGPLGILVNTLVAITVCYVSNFIFAKIFRANTNVESVFITALILVLIIPNRFPQTISFMILASGLAMAGKYFLTIERQHIFNPAAAAVAGLALLSPERAATWWVGTPYMLPLVLIGGLLVVRKINRFRMVIIFLLTYLLLIGVASFARNMTLDSVWKTWQTATLKTGLLFFAFVMLTEPVTAPGRKELRGYFALLVGALFATPLLRLWGFVLTPELALVIGNVFSHFVSPRSRLDLELKQRINYSADTFGFSFNQKENLHYLPGQYLEWTLPHSGGDSRGNRRYFSLASSPTEEDLLLAVKFYNPSSSYKKALYNLGPGAKITASSIAGDFVLPTNLAKPLVFIAGGVGIAPFRSMVKYIVDKKLKADIIILYSNNHHQDILYSDLFTQASEFGVRTYYTLTDLTQISADWQGGWGFIDQAMISAIVPDFKKRIFFISGPQLMVQKFEDLLSKMKVRGSQVVVDYFPGYADK